MKPLNNNTLIGLLASLAMLLALSGCTRAVIIGGVDASEMDTFDLPRHYVAPEDYAQKIERHRYSSSYARNINLKDPGREHVYVLISSGRIKMDPSKIYHWVAEGEEHLVPEGYGLVRGSSTPIAPEENVLADSAEYVEQKDMSAEGMEQEEVAYQTDIPMDAETGEGYEPGAVAAIKPGKVEAETAMDGGSPAHKMGQDMADETSMDTLAPDVPGAAVAKETVDIAYQPDTGVEPKRDTSPDPYMADEPRFNMDEIVNLVFTYESAMRRRDADSFPEVFSGDAIFNFNMQAPDGKALRDTYDLEQYMDVHRRGWSEEMDYDFRVNDVSVAVSADGTTAVAEGIGTEIMKAKGNKVTAKSRITFVIEERDGSLMITSLEAEGDLNAFSVH